MLKICCRSSKDLEEIHRSIKEQKGVGMTRTHYVLRTEKNIYSILPPFQEEES